MKLRWASSVREISAADWDRCANPLGFNPFVTHAFFRALEDSGSAVRETGWAGHHLIAEENRAIAGIVPGFIKPHSYGEYVFDHAFADAYARAGGRYYPKLQCAVPFTPVTGPRFLSVSEAVKKAMAEATANECRQRGLSSAHVTFLSEADALAAGPLWLRRSDVQFHWQNRSYASFEEFLATLASRKRKSIRKEREAARASGVTFHWITGSDLREEHLDAFFAFYMDTGSRKWGSPYLTRPFFSLIGESLARHILLVMCKRAGRWIAGALNLVGSDAIYGRNWGAIEHLPFLHFEACYYQAIDFAIANRLARVEAGAQGEHKLARGYEPVITHSLHHFTDARLQRAVADYLARERPAVAKQQEMLEEYLPFKEPPDA